MSIPENINKKHLLQAIEKIDEEGIPIDANSQYYDVVYNGKKYPPKLIISLANIFANGVVLDRQSFAGGLDTQSFKILKDNGFVIEKKSEINKMRPNVWVEKTLVNGRADRIQGERALGKALWSPQKDKRGADIYKNMRAVQHGDIVIHLIDNQKFSGVSLVKKSAIETAGIAGTDWDGTAYLIELYNYTTLKPTIDRTDLLIDKNKSALQNIANKSEVFYNNKLDLRQGAYLTPCPTELLRLINETYNRLSNTNLPFIENIDFEISDIETFNTFDLKNLINHLTSSGLQLNERIITRFAGSLLTKPFVILTGLSGSGKTKLAQAFAMWICENENQY